MKIRLNHVKTFIGYKSFVILLHYFSPYLFLFFNITRIPTISFMILLLGIFGGVFYCGWICPMGFFQDLTTLIAKKIKIKQKTLSLIERGLFIYKYLCFRRR